MGTKLDDSSRFNTVEFSGRFSGPDLLDWMIAFREHRTPAAVLCDMSAVDFNVPSGEVISAAQTCSARGVAIPCRIAFVVTDRLGYGLLRMFISFLGVAAAESASVFEDQTGALEWLNRHAVPTHRSITSSSAGIILSPARPAASEPGAEVRSATSE